MGIRSDFNFSKYNDQSYLITNYAGRYAFLDEDSFTAYCNGMPDEKSKDLLIERLFYSEEDKEVFVRRYSDEVRYYRDYLFTGTGLHIFVLTSQCNLNCVYCQASTNKTGNMMSKETAEKCVDLALQAPNRYLSFEFQGGEPLANFEVLKHIVLYTIENCKEKTIEFNVVSNLTLLTDEMIRFFAEYNINVSTSLDGNSRIHNNNRPFPGENSYEKWRSNYCRLVAGLGHKIGAIQTTTKFSLDYYREIVDAYIENGFDRVFIRPLTPLGYAASRWNTIGYTADEFLTFYNNALLYIIEKAKEGVPIAEGHAVIFLGKILNHKAGNYTELRSPCGAGLGQLAYNYDGRIYCCDEGRMMAEMGDHSFQLGSIESNYKELFDNSVCKAVATASCLENSPLCSDCVFSPFCGTCPVLNYYENNNLFCLNPSDYKCQIYKGMLKTLFSLLNSGDEQLVGIFKKWCNCNC